MLLQGGCSSPPPILNSERIEQRYGSYGVQVIEQSASGRLSCLYSGSGPTRSCRTIALVDFLPAASPRLAEPLARVRGGASLGATLAAAGFRVQKTNRHLGSYTLRGGDGAPWSAWLGAGPAPEAALHVYELSTADAAGELPVATVLELHHPDYLSPAKLRRLYSGLPGETATAEDVAGWRRRLDELAGGGAGDESPVRP